MHNKRTWLHNSIVLATLVLSLPAYGYIVDRLYEADLMTKSKDATEREIALSEGLEQVLTRVSGKPEVVKHPTVASAIKNPNRFVQQYAYHGDNLEAVFNPGLVQKLLSDAQFPIWSQNRPELVLWLAMENGKDRRLVGIETDPQIVALIERSANLRGLPVVVPLMDIEDMSKVTVTDIASQFPSALEQASERYRYDGLLVGYMRTRDEDSNNWQTEWKLIIDGQSHTWQSDGLGINQAIQTGIDGVVDKLASLYAVTPSKTSGQAILLRVDDIFSVTDYAKAMAYLKNLSHVQDVYVHQVEAGRTVFKVIPKHENGLEAITSSMDLSSEMVALAGEGLDDVDVAYRWISRDS